MDESGASDPGAKSGAKSGPKTPEDGPGPSPRMASRVKAVSDALRGLVRELNAGPVEGEKVGEALELRLALTVDPQTGWEVRFPTPLAEQLEEQLLEARARRAIFKKGRVFCFLCESSQCPHAHPPSSLTVFTGYSSSGVPRWGEFAQVLIDTQDPEVDQLFGEPPRHLVRQRSGKSLRSQQLASFGRTSRSYSILGQVEVGYLAMRDGQDPASPHRVAMTFQAVETRGTGGALQLELNPLVRLPHDQDFLEVLAGGWNPWILRACRLAARDLEALAAEANRQRQKGSPRDIHQVMGRVPGVLRAMARSLEGGAGQARRRTRHVEHRRDQKRPVHKALDDVSKITAQDMFHDGKTGNVVIRGSNGRAHAFSREGKHVTTFVLQADAVESRLRSRRWKPVDPVEAQVIKQLIEEKGKQNRQHQQR